MFIDFAVVRYGEEVKEKARKLIEFNASLVSQAATGGLRPHERNDSTSQRQQQLKRTPRQRLNSLARPRAV